MPRTDAVRGGERFLAKGLEAGRGYGGSARSLKASLTM